MATVGGQGYIIALIVSAVLGRHDGGGGLEGHTGGDRHAIADATLDAAGAVAGGDQAPILPAEGIVVAGAGGLHGPSETGPDLAALAGRQAEKGPGQGGVELGEDRIAQARRQTVDDQFQPAAQTVSLLGSGQDGRLHGGGGLGVWTAGRMAVDPGPIQVGRDGMGRDVMDPGDPGDDAQVRQALAQDLFGHRPGCHPADGLASRGPPATLPGPQAVLGIVGEVGVAGAVDVVPVLVATGTLVAIADHQGQGGAQGPAILAQARQDLDGVGLLARGGQGALARTAAVQLGLDGGAVQWQSGRTAVDDAAHGRAVALAEGGDGEQGSEGIGGHGVMVPGFRGLSSRGAGAGSGHRAHWRYGGIMRYEGHVIRPPSEADSLLLQATIGCSHNRCTFCGAYRSVAFRIRSQAEIDQDLAWAARHARHQDRVFLCDGDALMIPQERLRAIMQAIARDLPWVRRISLYANAGSIAGKSDADLGELRRLGLRRVYMGLETGDDALLRAIDKGVDAAAQIRAGQRIRQAGISLSVTALLGLAGAGDASAPAAATAVALSQMAPDHIAVLSLMLVPGSPLAAAAARGAFLPATAMDMLQELRALVAAIDVPRALLLVNHASNHLPITARLPSQRAEVLARIDAAIAGRQALRPEALRGL